MYSNVVRVYDSRGRFRWSTLGGSGGITAGRCGDFACIFTPPNTVVGYDKRSGDAVFSVKADWPASVIPCSGSRFAVVTRESTTIYDVSGGRPRELFKAYGENLCISQDCSYVTVPAHLGAVVYSESWVRWVDHEHVHNACYDGRVLAVLDFTAGSMSLYSCPAQYRVEKLTSR
jgi:hypothetical protein